MNETAIECRNLSKVFKTGFFPRPVEALKSITFDIPSGKVTGFLGPNGSGKSTFLKVATDFISASKGKVTFFGGKEFSEVKKDIGFVPEKPMYPSSFTGQQILNFHAKLTSERSSTVDELVKLVGLEAAITRSFKTYSKGMKQRLAIAQALLPDPKLLILDEPLSGLDPDGREVLIQVIQRFAARPGKTVILSSHLLEDLQRICNNLVVIESGELLFSGDPGAVFKPDQFSIRLKKSDAKDEEVVEIKCSQKDLNLKLAELISQGVQFHSIEPESKAISALYFELTRDKFKDRAKEKMKIKVDGDQL
jgi:ABC-2 type transport system ATP-binding protein